jgi:Uma2 family endonuclease
MSQALAQKQYFTVEEYLDIERQAQYKSEYYNGDIFAMAGGSPKHSAICVNLTRRISESLDNKDCLTFDSNLKLEIPKFNAYVYPDVMVVCGDVELSEMGNDIITNPVLIVEILSQSTESYDRIKKFEYYRTLPTVKEYALVSQDEPKIEIYLRKNETIWVYSEIAGIDKAVLLKSIDCELALREIYQKVFE